MKFRTVLSNWLVLALLLALTNDCCGPQNLTFQKDRLKEYYKSGKYEAEIQTVINRAASYVRNRTASGATNLAVVLDIDETSLSDWDYLMKYQFGFEPASYAEWVRQGIAKPVKPTLEFYNLAKSLGAKVFFVTGRNQSLQADTMRNLEAVGYTNFDGIYLKPDNFHPKSISIFKVGARQEITQKGLAIIANIGDQESDLSGGLAERAFKLPNPFYYLP